MLETYGVDLETTRSHMLCPIQQGLLASRILKRLGHNVSSIEKFFGFSETLHPRLVYSKLQCRCLPLPLAEDKLRQSQRGQRRWGKKINR